VSFARSAQDDTQKQTTAKTNNSKNKQQQRQTTAKTNTEILRSAQDDGV
jgi:hypothetical protein